MAIMQLVNKITSAVERNETTIEIFLDFDHNIIIYFHTNWSIMDFVELF